MRTREHAVNLSAFLGYVAVSCGYFGWRLLPHPGRSLVATSGWPDPQAIIWSFAWWPHAILHWTNPLYPHALWAPVGFNFAWANAAPALAVAFTPVTLVFGPSVAYNVAALLLPALSAWAAFFLLKYLTRSTWAALVGGYLYGFSSFILAHQLGGHLSLTAAFVPPLIVYVLLRYLSGELGNRGLAWRLGLLVALQAYIAIEVAATTTLMLGLGLIVSYVLAPEARERLDAALRPIAAGFLIAGVLAAPFLYYALFGTSAPAYFNYLAFSADPVNLVVPTVVIGWGGKTYASFSAHFPGDTNEQDSYVGIPSLLIAALLLWRGPWSRSVRVALAGFVVATVVSFGPDLYVHGHRLFGLPWAALYHLPLVVNLIPSRVAIYGTLALSTLVALWIASRTGRVWRRPYFLPLLAVAALVPPFWTPMFVQRPPRLAFFSEKLYEKCFPSNETLLIFPFGPWGSSELWQAESNFYFNVIGGYLGRVPIQYRNDATMNLLFTDVNGPRTPTARDLVALATRWRADRVVAAVNLQAIYALTTRSVGFVYPTQRMLRAFGSVQRVGDVLVSPACGRPPLSASRKPEP